jgi:hypothetical protein
MFCAFAIYRNTLFKVLLSYSLPFLHVLHVLQVLHVLLVLHILRVLAILRSSYILLPDICSAKNDNILTEV